MGGKEFKILGIWNGLWEGNGEFLIVSWHQEKWACDGIDGKQIQNQDEMVLSPAVSSAIHCLRSLLHRGTV